MAIPEDFKCILGFQFNVVSTVKEARAICPHCRNAVTFTVISCDLNDTPSSTEVRVLLRCQYSLCRKILFVLFQVEPTSGKYATDFFFMYPSRTLDARHPAVPAAVAEDWEEAQKVMELSAVKAAAVMARRVLYGILLDKKCKLHPLHEGLAQLRNDQRLPAIFDRWLPAITEDGHDAAHPDRALSVSSENIQETMGYTSELIRVLYVEPYEFEIRLSRNAAVVSNPRTKR